MISFTAKLDFDTLKVRCSDTIFFFFFFVYPSQHTTHTTKAERRAEESPRRLFFSVILTFTQITQTEYRKGRSSAEALGGQTTRGCIEGDEPGDCVASSWHTLSRSCLYVARRPGDASRDMNPAICVASSWHTLSRSCLYVARRPEDASREMNPAIVLLLHGIHSLGGVCMWPENQGMHRGR